MQLASHVDVGSNCAPVLSSDADPINIYYIRFSRVNCRRRAAARVWVGRVILFVDRVSSGFALTIRQRVSTT